MKNQFNSPFFFAYRRKGFAEVLDLLIHSPNYEIERSQVFASFTQKGLYPNVFYRVQEDLIKLGIINYRVHEVNHTLVLYLTEKGKNLSALIEKIDTLIQE